MAPVSVAMSTRCVAPICFAYHKRIAENQPALGVGVDDLHRLARCALQDIAGPDGAAAGHVLGDRNHADDTDRRLQFGDGAHGTRDRGAAGHVVLHPIHVRRGLDRDAARVERDAFADEPQHGRRGRAARARTVSQPGAAARRCHARHPEACPCRAARARRDRARRPSTRRRARSARADRQIPTGVSALPGSLSSCRAMLQCRPITRPRCAARSAAVRVRSSTPMLSAVSSNGS